MSAHVRTAPISGLDLSAPGALDRLFSSMRSRFGDARMGPEDDEGDAGGDQPQGEDRAQDQQVPADKGFPENTPLAQMDAEQRAAYWQHQARKHEARASSRKDYDEIAAKAKAYDEQVAASATEQERAVTDAVARGRAEAMAEANTKVATAMVRAALGARGLDAAAVSAVLAPINPGAFVVDGDVDTDAVAAWAAAAAGPPAPERRIDLGQGVRESGRVSGVAAGRAAYAESKAKRAS